MKRYIIFSNNIANIGGAQLYILRKARWLSSRNYEVTIVTANREPVLLKEIEQFNIIYKPELNYPPNILNRAEICNVIDDIITKIRSNYYSEDTYIESHQTSPALWAEILAERIKCLNIVYMIAPVNMKRKIFKKFFVCKLIKGELLGCNESYIEKNFKIHISGESYTNNYFNIPFDKNEIRVNNDKVAENNEYDLKILTISRIDKTYIKETIKQISEFAQKNSLLRIKYDIYVDRTSGQKYDELSTIIRKYNNLNFTSVLMEPVIPLNSHIFENKDLFIGMGTSIINSSSMKIPSLVIDYRNNKYYGYFGYNHFEFGTSNSMAKHNLEDVISLLILNKRNKEKLGEAAYDYFINNYGLDSVNCSFITFMEKQNKVFSNYCKINKGLKDIRDLVDFLLVKSFGIEKSLSFRKKVIDFYYKNRRKR